MWIERYDVTKKRFFIKPYGYNAWSYKQFSFHANVLNININRVVDSFKFRLKFPQKELGKTFKSAITG